MLGISRQAVTKRANREAWKFSKRAGRGGGKIYSYCDLPEDVQAAITLHEAQRQPAKCSFDESKPIPDSAHETGLARFKLHADWTRFRAGQKSKSKADEAFFAAYNLGNSHPEIYETLGKTSRQSMFRWDRKLRDNDGDYRCLCDYRGWAQAKNVQGNIGPEAEETFLSIYLNPQRPSISLSFRATCSVLEQKGLPVPSKRSTYRFVERYTADHNDLVVLMRDGEKALADKVGPYITRDSSLLQVGDCLVADGHKLNLDCIHPQTGRPARMTLICWYDWASRMPVGWEVMPSEDTIAISSALFMAIKNIGKIPRCVYLDNGRAFKSKFFTETDPDLTMLHGLYARLGIAVQFSKPYWARSKTVERFFGTFDNQCARLLASYRGNSIADKPAYLARNEKFHIARHNKNVPTIQDFLEIWSAYLGDYGMQPHEGLHGMLPLEILAAGRGKGVDVSDLTRHFLYRKEVTPRRCRIRLFGIDFESEGLYGLKKPVIAMWSWADLSEIQLYTKEGHSLGPARPVEALHPLARVLGDDLDVQKIREANKKQAKLKKMTLQIAKETDSSGLIEAIPWVEAGNRQRVELSVVPKSEKEPPASPPEMSQEERAELERAIKEQAARIEAQPEYELPIFQRPYDKAAHLFDLHVDGGVQLFPKDLAFMREYWRSDEYLNVSKPRFDTLVDFYTQTTGRPVILPWQDPQADNATGIN